MRPFSIVDDQIHHVLNCTGNKTHVNYNMQLNLFQLHMLCNKKLNFVMQPPKRHSNACSINECMQIFHKARNVDKIKSWKKLHNAMKTMKMVTISFNTLLKYIKNADNLDDIESVKITADGRFVMRRGKKSFIDVSETSTLINEKAHSHVSLMTDSLEDAELILNLSRSNNPCRQTMSNYANFSIANDPHVTLGNMSSARLKSLSRIIASESERTLCTHMCVIIACQFRVGNWINKPNNLSPGALAAVKLAKHMLNSDEVHPMDSRYALCFDEHSHSYTLGYEVSHARRPLGKRSLNSSTPDRSLKKYFSNWVQARKSDKKFKSATCKEQEVFCAAGMRGKKCMRFPILSEEECPNLILIVELKGLGLGKDLNPNSNVTGCAIFSQRKENASSGAEGDDDD